MFVAISPGKWCFSVARVRSARDFIVVEGRRPIMMIECKLSDQELSPSLKYVAARFPSTPAFQISAHGKKDVAISKQIRLMPAHRFLADLV